MFNSAIQRPAHNAWQTVFNRLEWPAVSKALKSDLKGILGPMPSMRNFSNQSNYGPVHQNNSRRFGPTIQSTRSNSHHPSSYNSRLDPGTFFVHPPVMPLCFPVICFLMCLCLVDLLPATKAYSTPLSLIILYAPLASRPLRFSSYPGARAAPRKSWHRNSRSTIFRRPQQNPTLRHQSHSFASFGEFACASLGIASPPPIVHVAWV